MARHRGSVAHAALALVALSGCGARTAEAGDTPSITPTDPTVTTTTTSVTPVSTPSTASGGETSPPNQDNPCKSFMLSGMVEPQDSSAGNRYAALVVTNDSAQPCTLWGYGNLELTDRTRTALPTEATRALEPKPTVVTLAPKATAKKTLHWTVVPTGDEPTQGPCQPAAAGMRVMPPDETEPFVVEFDFGPVCAHGLIETSAYFAE